MKSFTLIEIMVAIAIFALISVMMGGVFISIQEAQQRQRDKIELLEEANWAMEFMCNELRQAQLNSIPLNWSRDFIRFRSRTGSVIRYRRDPLQNSLLCRCEGGGGCRCSLSAPNTAQITQYISNINFQRPAGENFVIITFTLQKGGYSYTLQSSVRPKN